MIIYDLDRTTGEVGVVGGVRERGEIAPSPEGARAEEEKIRPSFPLADVEEGFCFCWCGCCCSFPRRWREAAMEEGEEVAEGKREASSSP